MAAFCMPIFANSLWQLSNETSIPIGGEQLIVPDKYQLAQLAVSDFNLFQAFIPEESMGSFPQIVLPTPAGGLKAYYIYENQTLAPALKSKYPTIRTYTLISANDARITGKLDFTKWGLHAVVFDRDNTYYIDPYKHGLKDWYLVYYKKDYSRPLNKRMECLFEEDEHIMDNAISLTDELPPLTNVSNKTFGTDRRTYRLALACTMEYSAAVGGTSPTKATVLSAMATTMNRVNGVFEREFAMTAQLIGNTDDLIYLPGGSDPYSNNNGGTMLGQNQTNVTNIIGATNYDFGHVFSTGGGGIASLGSVCRNNRKAQGVTGAPNPVGDAFDVDYVAHEMGHQFGGSHTFNSESGSCSGNRSSTNAYEPGSASTIQGYAGICGSDNIQNNSDDYYHARSIFQMYTHIEGNGNCAAITTVNNNPPSVTDISLKSYNIPYKTSFELTANASDVDGDPITHCWEQYDRGSAGAWNVPNLEDEPLFRSFYPTADSVRTFPQWRDLMLNRIDVKGEVLPEVAREMRFRLMVRDIRNGFGTFNRSDNTLDVNVINTGSALFRVTSLATANQTWTGDTKQFVTWDVAGTDGGTINTPTVDIYISVDTGKTWTYKVASNVPNDGSEEVFAPNIATTRARVKVKGHNNIFFDVNDAYFEIVPQVYPASTSDISHTQLEIYPNPASAQVSLKHNLSLQSLSLLNITGQQLVKFNPIQKNLNLSNLANGIYFLEGVNEKNIKFVKKLIIE